jgi:alkylation response protein AidB-like acyl-CoA dehydrogenase
MKSLIWRESISSGDYSDTLTQTKKRKLMATINTIPLNEYWADDAFPFELLPPFKELQLGYLGFEGYGCAGGSQKLFRLVAMELARVDASFCTFFGVHSSLAMGSIYLDGSEAQKQPKASWFAPHSRDLSTRRARVGLCPGHRRALL